MQNPSRRAFLGGKAPELSPWDQFILELQRKTQGSVRVLDSNLGQALCTVQQSTDMHHARQLCQTFGVKLYVGADPILLEDQTEPVLGLDVSHLNQLMPVNEQQTQWFMQAGVTVAQLRTQGFAIPAEVPAELWVIQWLGEPQYQSYALSQLQHSGLVHASLLMADGSLGSLGPFGVQNSKPLNTATLRAVVPQLFQLASAPVAAALLALPDWLAQYRLDILSMQNPSLNLAHLLLGAGQDLGLLDWVVLDKNDWQAAPLCRVLEPASAEHLLYAQELDAAVKAVFDPDALFFTATS